MTPLIAVNQMGVCVAGYVWGTWFETGAHTHTHTHTHNSENMYIRQFNHSVHLADIINCSYNCVTVYPNFICFGTPLYQLFWILVYNTFIRILFELATGKCWLVILHKVVIRMMRTLRCFSPASTASRLLDLSLLEPKLNDDSNLGNSNAFKFYFFVYVHLSISCCK